MIEVPTREIVRGLTIMRPYAGLKIDWAEAHDGEVCEFRNGRTHIRGPIAIRASAGKIACVDCPALWHGDCDPDWPRCSPVPDAPPWRLVASAIIAAAELVDCRKVSIADVDMPGCPLPFVSYAWVLRDLRPLREPIFYSPPRGARTWFTVPEEVRAEIARQLE